MITAKKKEDEKYGVRMWEYSSTERTSFSRTISMSADVTMTMDKSSLSAYLRKSRGFLSMNNLTILLFLFISLSARQVAGDPVYVRSGDFGQLVTSSTLRWSKGIAKDPLMLKQPNGSLGVICRVYHTTLRGVGLVSDEAEGSICNIDTQEGAQGSDKFQTISVTASRLVWAQWKRPNPPPTGAVVVSVKPQKFLAADLNSTEIGILDPNSHLGAAMFPRQAQPSTSCLVLVEIEPVRYELTDIQLKRMKGFMEEEIVLAYGKLSYKLPSDDFDGESSNFGERKKERVESILSYTTNTYDYFGQGNFMAKGLHTTIYLPDGSTKTMEWGLPLTRAGKTETMTAVADLYPGTAINVTLVGTRLNGEMSYWATLRTFFKDGTSSTRLMDNHRKIIEIQDIRLEHSPAYFISNSSIVPEPTTTTTTTIPPPTPIPFDEADVSESDGSETEKGLALPVESSPHSHNMQSDQSLHFHSDGKSDATSVALSHFSLAWFSVVLFLLNLTFTTDLAPLIQ